MTLTPATDSLLQTHCFGLFCMCTDHFSLALDVGYSCTIIAYLSMALFTVDLGFVEKLEDKEKSILNSKYFPSKVGGKPAWLSFENLPKSDQVICSSCQVPLVFLLQIYAPNEDDESAFHRTIFMFCCNNSECLNKQFKVFRCQLERKNKYYSEKPPNYDLLNEDTELKYPEQFGTKTCNYCGCFAEKKCAQCQLVFYCSKVHQTRDWTEGGHKSLCKLASASASSLPLNSKGLLSEFELLIESDDTTVDEDSGDEDGNVEDYNKIIEQIKPDCQNENLDSYEEVNQEDKAFVIFKKTIKSNKDQVIRYYKRQDKECSAPDANQPLWVSDVNQIASFNDIPKCSCGSDRKLEFQVMPQLLNRIDNCNADWGTLIVYTCSKGCVPAESGYVEEFIWKQDFS